MAFQHILHSKHSSECAAIFEKLFYLNFICVLLMDQMLPWSPTYALTIMCICGSWEEFHTRHAAPLLQCSFPAFSGRYLQMQDVFLSPLAWLTRFNGVI